MYMQLPFLWGADSICTLPLKILHQIQVKNCFSQDVLIDPKHNGSFKKRRRKLKNSKKTWQWMVTLPFFGPSFLSGVNFINVWH